jgi:hypothetical protein
MNSQLQADERVASLVEAQEGLLTRQQLLEAGLTARKVESGSLVAGS